ncbi:MAG: glycosyltransferase [Pirellulaceae bacterium]|nr:glycosyltransferase [Pirellulaceae bacterium]
MSAAPATPVRTLPVRLALVIHALHGGGAERLMSQLAQRWATSTTASPYEVHLITLADSATDQYPLPAQVRRYGLDLMQPSTGLWQAWRANRQRVTRLRQVLSEIQPDFILSFCDRMNVVTITAAYSLSVPLWIAEHSDPEQQRLGLVWETWRQWAYRRLIRRPRSGCVALTDPIAAGLRQRFRGLQVEVIPPAIQGPASAPAQTPLEATDKTTLETNVESTDETTLAAPREATGKKKQLLSLGRHSPEKNLSALLAAWQLLSPQFPQWQLVMAGDGPERAALMQLSERSGIQSSVHFPGWIADPWPLYQQSELLALSSHYEGFPVAMLEAMHSGVACVSTPCCASVKQLAELGAIALTLTSTPEAIAAELSQWMSDDSQRQALAKRGQQVASEYSWTKIGVMWDHVLLSALAK